MSEVEASEVVSAGAVSQVLGGVPVEVEWGDGATMVRADVAESTLADAVAEASA